MRFLCCFLCLLVSGTAQAEDKSSFAAVTRTLDEFPVRHMAVLIGDEKGTAYIYQRGRFRSDRQVASASAAKLLSAVMLLKLVEKGTLSLEDHPQDYLEFWTDDPSDPRSQVTLDQLLGFTSGFNYRPEERGCIQDRDSTVQACAEEFYRKGLMTEPGTAYHYGPAHLQIAVAMAEVATGTGFHALFDREVAQPLGMERTAFVFPSRENPRASGGAQTSADDYELLLRALLAGQMLDDPTLLTRDRTEYVVFVFRPRDEEVPNTDWHYAAGAWIECDIAPFDESCRVEPTLSSSGAFGFTPWIDFEEGYYGIIAMQEWRINRKPSSLASVNLEQALQPLIEEALDEIRENR